MLFGAPLVGNNLVQIPRENQVKNDIDNEAGQRNSQIIEVELSAETGSHLDRLSVENILESEDKSAVRNDAYCGVDAESGIVGIGSNERHDVLQDEEE